VEIVIENIVEKFGGKLAVLKACHQIAKESQLLHEKVKGQVRQAYYKLKDS
jgi:hypothetical protein